MPAPHSHSHRRSRSRDRFEGPPEVSRRRASISSSRERSRERERRRRKAQAECIRKAGGFQKLADDMGHETVSLFWDGFQWVAKTGQTMAMQNDPALMNSTRKLRRLYFGNLPLHLGLTETGFQDIVWLEMKRRKFCSNADLNPVLYVWFAKEKGNYGFVEFATVEETERALTMDGMNCMGIPLKVSRPNDYSTASVTQSQAMAQMGQKAAAILMGGAAPPPPPGPPPGSQAGTSRFVKISQAVLASEIEDEEEYQDILDDVKAGCAPHGTIVRSSIVTPKEASDRLVLGDVIMEFDNVESADNCILKMSGRSYFGRPIQMKRIDEFPVELLTENTKL